jgi:hypothetical protein
MNTRRLALLAACAATWTTFGSPVLAADLNGAWATDVSVCNKVFTRKGGTIGFAQDSDQFGGGFIVDGDKIRGQLQTCTIKSRKQDGKLILFIAACANDIMASSVQFSAKLIDDNTISRTFPGMGDELDMKYARCPN